MPEVATRLAEFGVEAVAEDPAAFVRHIQAEYARNTRIIAQARMSCRDAGPNAAR